VIPLAMTAIMEVIRRNKSMTLTAGVMLLSMVFVLMDMRLKKCAISRRSMSLYRKCLRKIVGE